MIFGYWKLHRPRKGLAMSSPALADPVFQRGNPADWLAAMTVPAAGLQAAVAKDEHQDISDVTSDHTLLKGPRSHLELNVLYVVFAAEQIGLQIPVDGSVIMSYYLACLPSSRGTVTLASTDPLAAPIINPAYSNMQADRYVMREVWRVLSRLILETPQGKELVADEISPEGYSCLPSTASDEEIDKRVGVGGMSCSHPTSSCSMGKVVDARCRVMGVRALRVVDLSMIPVPLATRYQAPVFALAEQAVEIILEGRESSGGGRWDGMKLTIGGRLACED